MNKNQCPICKKIGQGPKSCFFRPGRTEKKNKSIRHGVANLTKTWKDGKLQITTSISSTKASVQNSIKNTIKKRQAENSTTEEDVEFIKEIPRTIPPKIKTSSLTTSSISVKKINISPSCPNLNHKETAICNITDHQLMEKKIKMLKAENKLLKIEIHETKKLYIQEYSSSKPNKDNSNRIIGGTKSVFRRWKYSIHTQNQ